MSDFVPSEIYHFSSVDAAYSNNNNAECTFQLKRPIVVPQDYQVYISLINLKVPFTWNCIDDSNNVFGISWSDNTTTSYIIPNGSYGGNMDNPIPGVMLADMIQTLMNALDTGKNGSWSVEYNFNLLCLDFTWTLRTGGSLNPIAMSFPNTSSLWKNLGFINDTPVQFATLIANVSELTTGVLRVNTVEDIFLRCDLISEHVAESTRGGTESNVLAKITVDKAPGQYIDFYPYNKNAISLTHTNVYNIKLILTKMDGTLLNLRNVPWTGSIRFDYRQGVSNVKYVKPKQNRG